MSKKLPDTTFILLTNFLTVSVISIRECYTETKGFISKLGRLIKLRGVFLIIQILAILVKTWHKGWFKKDR